MLSKGLLAIARTAALAFVLLAGPAAAQLPGLPGLPSLPGPSLPPVLPGDPLGAVGDTVRSAGDVADPRRLLQLRADRLTALVRRYPRDLELDRQGQPVVRGEVLALAPSPEALAAARRLGFTVAGEERLEGVGVTLVTLRSPARMDAQAALRRLRRADPKGQYDLNHLHFETGLIAQPSGPARASAPAVDPSLRVGLIDTGVDVRHPALAGVRVEQQGFAAGGVRPAAHGTAVASLISGNAGAFRGAAPGAALMVADVYGSGPKGGSTDAVLRGLDWMGRGRVPVVNVSLVGPANALMQAAVAGLTRRGTIVVAAVGNDGPAAPPAYPASYPEVIAVTGVDARRRPLLEAGRALHVDFAAPASDMAAASGAQGYAGVRGTSFAAPIVAGRLARHLKGRSREAAVASLAGEAQDLGPRGPDRTFGRGFVGADVRISPTALR